MQDDPPVFVLIGGPRYSGKDFVANLIAANTSWDRSSFAKAIKTECAQAYGLDFDRLMTDQQYKDDNREVLIAHGRTRRALDPDYWARQLYESHNGIPMVVSDFRIPKEGSFLRDKKALIISVLIIATDDVRAARGWVPNAKIDNDPTERALSDWAWDTVIYNNGPFLPDISDLIDLVNSRRMLA